MDESTPTCETCRFWRGNTHNGICERFPPVMNTVFISLIAADRARRPGGDPYDAADVTAKENASAWAQPVTYPHWSCGEHQLRDEPGGAS